MGMLDPTNLFCALSDATRLRLLARLTAEGELCVCELTHALQLSQPMISRHLATLRENGIVADRRLGLWIFYRLHPELPEWARDVLKQTFNGIGRRPPFAADRKSLRGMKHRPAAERCRV